MQKVIIGVIAVILVFNVIYFFAGTGAKSELCEEVYRTENIDREGLTCEYFCDYAKNVGQNIHKAVLAQKMAICYEETHEQPCHCGEG